MAASKKIKQSCVPQGKTITVRVDSEQYYLENPAWSFSSSDPEMWAFSRQHIGDAIWTEIFPRLSAFETQTWSDILIRDKKSNHSIRIENLNKIAQDRLAKRYIEAESLISLRLTGNHRMYGYMEGRVFHILWYDDNHGDNRTCVCRSKLKHT